MNYMEKSTRKRVIPSIGRGQWRWPMSWGLKDEWDFFPESREQGEKHSRNWKSTSGRPPKAWRWGSPWPNSQLPFLELLMHFVGGVSSLDSYAYRSIKSMVWRGARSFTRR